MVEIALTTTCTTTCHQKY